MNKPLELDSTEQFLDEVMGGAVEVFIQGHRNKKMKCSCGDEMTLDEFVGYPHDGGLADSSGKKWWVFCHCDNCGYDWSFWKIEQRIKREE